MQVPQKNKIAISCVLFAAAFVAIHFGFRNRSSPKPISNEPLELSADPIHNPTPNTNESARNLQQKSSPRKAYPNPGESHSFRAIGRHTRLASTNFEKGIESLEITNLPRSPIGKTRYALVRGLHASLNRIENFNEVAFANGIYFYTAQDERMPENAVFDKSVEKIGLWTGEVILAGDLARADEITKIFDLDIIKEEYGRAFFKAGPNFTLVIDGPRLMSFVAPGIVQLDIKFSKLVPQ